MSMLQSTGLQKFSTVSTCQIANAGIAWRMSVNLMVFEDAPVQIGYVILPVGLVKAYKAAFKQSYHVMAASIPCWVYAQSGLKISFEPAHIQMAAMLEE